MHRQGRLNDAGRLDPRSSKDDPSHFAALLHLGALRLQQGATRRPSNWRAGRSPKSPIGRSALQLAAALHALGRPKRRSSPMKARSPSTPIAPRQITASRNFDSTPWADMMRRSPAMSGRSSSIPNMLRPLRPRPRRSMRSREDEAIASYDEALVVDPEYVEALWGRAAVLQALRRHGEAIAAYHRRWDRARPCRGARRPRSRAARSEPTPGGTGAFTPGARRRSRSGETQLSLGAVLEELGRLEEAQQAFAAAVAIDPENVRFRVALAAAKRTCDGDPDLAAWRVGRATFGARPEDEQILSHFGLGRALSEVGRHDEFFVHLLTGNDLKRRHSIMTGRRPWRPSSASGAFTRELMRGKARAGHPSAAPIFIIGMPRSGSTLVQQILASHPWSPAAASATISPRAMMMRRRRRGRASLPELTRAVTADQLYRLGAEYLERVSAATAQLDHRQDAGEFLFRRADPFGAAKRPHPAHLAAIRSTPAYRCFAQLFWRRAAFRLRSRRTRPLLPRLCKADGTLATGDAAERRDLDVQYEELVADFEPQARRIVAHCASSGMQRACRFTRLSGWFEQRA